MTCINDLGAGASASDAESDFEGESDIEVNWTWTRTIDEVVSLFGTYSGAIIRGDDESTSDGARGS